MLQNIFPGHLATAQLFITFILSAAVFALVVRTVRELSNRSELDRFRNYVENIHGASSEAGIFGILYDSMLKMPFVTGAALWHYDSSCKQNAMHQETLYHGKQFCDFAPESCPLLKDNLEHYVAKAGGDIPGCPLLPADSHCRSICFPVISSKHHYSILQLQYKKYRLPSEAILSMVKPYMNIAGAVLQDKRMLYTLDQKASRDELTRLHNRSFLETYLKNQLEAAAFSGTELSIIMIDIDHYKSINDTYGHFTGDHVLAFFAGLVLNCIRKTDLLARYGGDEFIAVLPSASTKTAKTIAERIRQSLAGTRVPPFDCCLLPAVTCSLGISTYPHHGDSADSLIKASDIALYRAKQSGRNCTRVYNHDEFKKLSANS